MTPPLERRILAEGKYVRLMAGGGWEWVERINSSGAVVIAATTSDGSLLLVEQYRIPLGARVVDLPAGLAGDSQEVLGEPLIEAARRELLEETGYESNDWTASIEGPTSAGMTSEGYRLFLARDVRKVGEGGGDASEEILVHVVPIAGIESWLQSQRRQGILVDPKIYVGLYFAARSGTDR